MKPKILAIDDDEILLLSIQKILKLKNYQVDGLSNAQNLSELLKLYYFDAILLDVNIPGSNGIELLQLILKSYPYIPVIMISGQSDINTAVECLKLGAYDFIEKPLDSERLFVTLKNAIQKHDLLLQKDNILKELQDNFRMIGNSPAMLALVNKIELIAPTNAKVLITGESGTGKELVARALHFNSPRSGKPYIKMNCASVPSELLESQLFGHKKGSFTGATSDHRGKFLSADGGTLFLDEIGDMDIRLQAKLLRVLEEDEVEVIGDNTPYKIDVRIFAATNQSLSKLIRENKFREDLFYRLNVANIDIPPLRDRKEDILPLAMHFLHEFCNENNKNIKVMDRKAEALLLNQPWKGNVRELRNVIEKLVIFSSTTKIGYNDVFNVMENVNPTEKTNYSTSDETLPLNEARENFEKEYLLNTLKKYNWKFSETAKVLQIDRSNLFKKLKKYGIKK